ncbi:hypothetical protein GQ457_01G026440 [Hibiscus cannabinus]
MSQHSQLLGLLHQSPITQVNSSVNLAGINSFCSFVDSSLQWILDTGATDHILSDFNSLIDPIPVPSRFVQLPNGKSSAVTHTGSVHLSNDISLSNVLFVPHFTHNLISVSQLLREMNCAIHFYPDYCFLQYLSTGMMKGIGKRSKGLYFLQSSSFHNKQPFSFQSSSLHSDVLQCKTVDLNKITLWHARLGHVPCSQISRLSLFNDVSINNDCLQSCTICPLARQTRLPFPSSSTCSAVPFSLIHIDLWGPYRVSTHGGHRFFLTIVDDHSRMSWVYLLKLKSDAILSLQTFFNMVKTQFSATIQVVRSDNGSEFFNSECSGFF